MGYLPEGPGSADGHMLCTVCAKTYEDRRTCPVHAEEPLLDVRIDEVVLQLEADDDRNRRKLIGRWTMLLAVPAFLLSIVAMVAAELGSGLGGMLTFFLVGGAVSLGVALGNRQHKPRYERWTKRVLPNPALSDD
jgi:hypothetical protein